MEEDANVLVPSLSNKEDEETLSNQILDFVILASEELHENAQLLGLRARYLLFGFVQAIHNELCFPFLT